MIALPRRDGPGPSDRADEPNGQHTLSPPHVPNMMSIDGATHGMVWSKLATVEEHLPHHR